MRDPSRRLWEHLLLWDRSFEDEGLGFRVQGKMGV